MKLSWGTEAQEVPKYTKAILKLQKTLNINQKGKGIICREGTHQYQTCKI
jgi:hypothetical protein